jgi:exopolysaccharide production protein ExoZ
MKDQHLCGVDLVRFIAAALVVAFHFLYLHGPKGYLMQDAWVGWIGVEIFFVISGLAIANSALNSSAGKFLARRCLRLYPAAWICATISLLIVIEAGGNSRLAERYMRSMILFPNGPWVDDVYWTLGVEIGFYAVTFVLLAWWSFARINILAAAMCFINALFVSLECYPSRLSFFLTRHEQAFDVLMMARHGAFFALGIFLWLAARRRLLWWEKCSIALAIIVCIAEIILRSQDFLPPKSSVWLALIPVGLWIVALLWLLWETQNGPLNTRYNALLATLGLMTYPLYLIHDSLGPFVMKALIPAYWEALSLAVAACLFASWAIVRIEPYIRWVLRRITSLSVSAVLTLDTVSARPNRD